jgi:amidase
VGLPVSLQVDAAAVEQGRKVMSEASTQLREILVAGNLLILPALPGPPPCRDSPQEELEAWQRSTLQLSCLAPLAGLPQVRPRYNSSVAML